jgi:hypothetical protein
MLKRGAKKDTRAFRRKKRDALRAKRARIKNDKLLSTVVSRAVAFVVSLLRAKKRRRDNKRVRTPGPLPQRDDNSARARAPGGRSGGGNSDADGADESDSIVDEGYDMDDEATLDKSGS